MTRPNHTMKESFILILLLILTACAPASKDEQKTEYPTPRSAIKMRINAPANVVSIVIEARATDVDLKGLSNYFNVLSHVKVLNKAALDSASTVTLAIQPGEVYVRAYAFSDELPEGTSSLDGLKLSQATHFGRSEVFTAKLGGEVNITLNMKKYQALNIKNLKVSKVGTNYNYSFQTDTELSDPTSVTFTYNNLNPDYLSLANAFNEKSTGVLAGVDHIYTLESPNRIPNFLKIDLNHENATMIHEGILTHFCEKSICGDLPLALYNRLISHRDPTQFSAGVDVFWKTTTSSITQYYFAKQFFDMTFLMRQIQQGMDLSKLSIYRAHSEYAFDPNSTVATGLCPGEACMSISPTSQSLTNAPTDFFQNLTLMTLAPVAQDTQSLAFYPNAVQCVDALDRLGQDCGLVPQAASFYVENNRLFLTIFSGQDAQLEIYPKSQGTTGNPLRVIRLAYDNLDASGATASKTQGLALNEVFPALDNYYGRLRNSAQNGSLLDLNYSDWSKSDGATTATEVKLTNGTGQSGNMDLKRGETRFFSLNLEEGKTYSITSQTSETAGGALNLIEAYLLDLNNSQVLSSVPDPLLEFGFHPKKFLTWKALRSGVFHLKIVNRSQAAKYSFSVATN